MKEKIEALKAKIDSAIQATETGRALYELKLKFQAELKSIMSGMRDLPKEERPVFGKVVNEFKEGMEQKFEERAVIVRQKELQKKYEGSREEKIAMLKAMEAKLKEAKESGNEAEYQAARKR